MNNGVCIVTQPERTGTGKAHVHDLADILAEITSVIILTANVEDEAALLDTHKVVQYSQKGTGQWLPTEIGRFLINQIRLCLAIRRRPEGIILFFGTTSYVLPVLCGRLLGKRVVILPRGDVPLSLRLRWERTLPSIVARALAGLVTILERISYRLSHGIITYTPAMAAQLDLERFRSKLYPNGARFVDTDQFSVETPLENRNMTVGYVGRFDVEKRIPFLGEVAQMLGDDIDFLFVGDGACREELESTLATKIEAGSVEVRGWLERDSLPSVYNQVRLLMVPSHPTEGLPTTILEAFACGTPVMATPVSGVPDLVIEGETGFHLEEEEEPEYVADRIESILADEDTMQLMHRNCRTTVEMEYSFDGAVERYRSILENI